MKLKLAFVFTGRGKSLSTSVVNLSFPFDEKVQKGTQDNTEKVL